MAIDKQPFKPYRLEEERAKDKRKVFPVSLNTFEIDMLGECMQLIEQDQPSKAIRQLFHIAHAYLIHDQKVNVVLGTLFKNKKNNERRGVADFD